MENYIYKHGKESKMHQKTYRTGQFFMVKNKAIAGKCHSNNVLTRPVPTE